MVNRNELSVAEEFAALAQETQELMGSRLSSVDRAAITLAVRAITRAWEAFDADCERDARGTWEEAFGVGTLAVGRF